MAVVIPKEEQLQQALAEAGAPEAKSMKLEVCVSRADAILLLVLPFC